MQSPVLTTAVCGTTSGGHAVLHVGLVAVTTDSEGHVMSSVPAGRTPLSAYAMSGTDIAYPRRSACAMPGPERRADWPRALGESSG
eukprot:3083374-Rhodomonas_salina.6